MLLSNDEFLTRLEALLAAQKDHGTVFITQKRHTYQPEASTSAAGAAAGGDVEMNDAGAGGADEEEDREWPLLVRATEGNGKDKGKKVNISTVVQPADADAFISSYSTLLRASFAASLRPKRKKADQQRARAPRAAKRTVARLQRRAQQQAAGGGGADDVPDVEALVQKELAKKQGGAARSAATAGGAGGTFRPRLPKVVGPRRGAGIEKRRKTVRRREKAVERFKAGKKRAAAAQ
ncbi:RNA-binding signal recognition particle subunit SRP14 [Rhodotorula paludigena]|uniref:RNA-binding signal recognition particle subunit SRP14 n=1 Tax=Rhodotorula paludigena TaxID=86838 RepID=UPI0031733ED3